MAKDINIMFSLPEKETWLLLQRENFLETASKFSVFQIYRFDTEWPGNPFQSTIVYEDNAKAAASKILKKLFKYRRHY